MVSIEPPSSQKAIESIYPLSPMQQGLLFHALYAPDSRAFFLQVICTIEGEIDPDSLRRAWQGVLDRHPALRSAFVWEKLKQSLQVVQQNVELPWSELDWRSLSEAEREIQRERFLAEDRQKGFSLAKSPLMRVTCIRTGEHTTELIWSHHHLILDGWCLPLLLKEVFTAYYAYCRGELPALPTPRPYRDYIQWLQQRDSQKAAAFWQQELSGLATDSPLDLGHSGKATNDSVYEWQTVELPDDLVERLQAIARENRLTLSTLFQGAWAILLSRYTGNPDIVFGCLVSGRPPELAGVENMIGVFFNTLPTRVAVVGEESFLSWLTRLQERNRERLQYSDSSLAEIRGWGGIPRETPIWESVFAFQNFPIDEYFRRGDHSFRLENIQVLDRSDAPLTLTVIPGQKFSLQLEYYTERFPASAIARMLGHLQTLLAAIAVSPREKIARLPWLTDGERHQLLMEWNDTARDYPLERGLHRLIEEQIERTPNTVALVFEEQEVTYRQLNDRANQLAHHLRDLGVREDVMVGVLAERSLEMVIALLAILKAGGAYVPLDPELPSERLGYLLEDSGVSVLLTPEKWLSLVTVSPTWVFCLDRDWTILDRQSTDNLAVEVTGDHLAYTIYTSGSTGQPKGAMNTHRGIVNRLLWMQEAYGLTADDRVLQKTPFGFDVSVWEFFWPLMTGARLVLARPGGHRDSGYLVRTIEREQITTLHFVPSMLQVFLEEPDLARCSSLQRVICSGEALPVALQQRFFSRLSGQLHNLYGPTEAAIDVTYYACQPDSSEHSVPIGYPIANTSLYILDQDGQPVPIGVKGELHIGGVGLARGYRKRTELTEARFIVNPFRQDPGARLYKTGDLARYREDGAIEYCGRLDNQVKLRGFRIELGEIEVTLQQHPHIREVVVSVREIHPGDPVLVAYFVPLDSFPNENELRSFLENILPTYMIPSRFIGLDKMPLTPNGKVDRRALPVPDRGGVERAKEYIAPSTPVEETIAALVREILGIDRVGSEDSFFELGGHSLTATQLVSRLRSTFEIEFPLKDLFAAPTVKALARQVAEFLPISSSTTGPIARASRENRRLKISS